MHSIQKESQLVTATNIGDNQSYTLSNAIKLLINSLHLTSELKHSVIVQCYWEIQFILNPLTKISELAFDISMKQAKEYTHCVEDLYSFF